jgi:hypothetical protein
MALPTMLQTKRKYITPQKLLGSVQSHANIPEAIMHIIYPIYITHPIKIFMITIIFVVYKNVSICI